MTTLISDDELYLLESTEAEWDNDLFGELKLRPGEGFGEAESDDRDYRPCRCANTNTHSSDERHGSQVASTGEAFPFAAILPAIQTALPYVISALPAIAQTAGSLIQSITKGTTGGQTVKTAPAPIPQQPQSGNASTDQLLQSLINLLQNPQIMQLLANMASGVSTSILTKNGNISPANLLNLVSQLSGSAAAQVAAIPNTASSPQRTSETFFPEYVFDENGKLLIDPYDPVQHAELVNEMINT